MLTENEHREIEVLGGLQAALAVLENNGKPADPEIRKMYHEALNLTRKVMLLQWAVTGRLVEQEKS